MYFIKLMKLDFRASLTIATTKCIEVLSFQFKAVTGTVTVMDTGQACQEKVFAPMRFSHVT